MNKLIKNNNYSISMQKGRSPTELFGLRRLLLFKSSADELLSVI